MSWQPMLGGEANAMRPPQMLQRSHFALSISEMVAKVDTSQIDIGSVAGGLSAQMLCEECAEVFDGLRCGAQGGHIREEDVDHALPDMGLDLVTGSIQCLGIAHRVSDEDIILTNMDPDRWQAGEVAKNR